jgi:hypothetical protein
VSAPSPRRGGSRSHLAPASAPQPEDTHPTGADRARAGIRRGRLLWRRFFVNGPGVEFAVYPPLDRRAAAVRRIAGIPGLAQDVDHDGLALEVAGLPQRDDDPASDRLDELVAMVRALGLDRFLSVRASAEGKGGLIGPCAPPRWAPPGPWSFADAEILPGSKRGVAEYQIAVQLPGRRAFPPRTPMAVEASFRLAGDRDWTALWAPTLRALRRSAAGSGRRSAGERVEDVGLHRVIDEEMGDRVRLGLWWRPLPTEASATRGGDPAAAESSEVPAPVQPEPRIARPVPAMAPIADEPSGRTGPRPGVRVFRGDDEGYRAWIATHPDGFVANASGRGASSTLHRASCRFVAGGPTRRMTHQNPKVCSVASEDIHRWGREGGVGLTRCRVCRP